MFSYTFGEATTGSGHKIQEELKPGFEGPEKSLQVTFEHRKGGETINSSLRSVPQERWQMLCDLAHCKILSSLQSSECTAFVLSESSLFVYDSRIIMKTCGTTRLLEALDDCITIGLSRDLELISVLYARKNFTFPELQPEPYRSFEDECAFLNDRLGSARSSSAVIAGPQSADHWCYYFANFTDDDENEKSIPKLFEVKMHEIDPKAAWFFLEREGWTGKLATQESGIANLIPGQTIDEHLFSPCGYSMNGLLNNGGNRSYYSTIHITPEENCSYVSFETNLPLTDYSELLSRVLSIFNPVTFSVTIIGQQKQSKLNLPNNNNRAYKLCNVEQQIEIGGENVRLPISMYSCALENIDQHPLGFQSICRLAHIASALTTTTKQQQQSTTVQNRVGNDNDVVLISVASSPTPTQELSQQTIQFCSQMNASASSSSSSAANSDGEGENNEMLILLPIQSQHSLLES